MSDATESASASASAPDRSAERERLMLAALAHVAFDGWTGTALAAGAVDAGLDEIDARRLFPGGAAEVVRAFADWADRRMVERLAAPDVEAMRMHDRIRLAVRARIEAVTPYREAVRRGLAHFVLPANAASGLKALYRTVDAMWYAAGDRAADFGFYTKRGLLAGVFSATLVYWLDDTSEGHEATWAFLDRRIDDVMRIHRLRGRIERAAGALPDPFRLFAAIAARR
jgi:ubiquinone biosynthesis protein COQ9